MSKKRKSPVDLHKLVEIEIQGAMYSVIVTPVQVSADLFDVEYPSKRDMEMFNFLIANLEKWGEAKHKTPEKLCRFLANNGHNYTQDELAHSFFILRHTGIIIDGPEGEKFWCGLLFLNETGEMSLYHELIAHPVNILGVLANLSN